MGIPYSWRLHKKKKRTTWHSGERLKIGASSSIHHQHPSILTKPLTYSESVKALFHHSPSLATRDREIRSKSVEAVPCRLHLFFQRSFPAVLLPIHRFHRAVSLHRIPVQGDSKVLSGRFCSATRSRPAMISMVLNPRSSLSQWFANTR